MVAGTKARRNWSGARLRRVSAQQSHGVLVPFGMESAERAAPMAHLSWDHPDLFPPGDSAHMAAYRRLQSWYRQTELNEPTHGRTKARTIRKQTIPPRRVGSLLAEVKDAPNDGRNFLPSYADDIVAYAK